MLNRARLCTALIAGLLLFPPVAPVALACCPVSRGPVVNADQAVIILWNPATHTQQFIRQASFKTQDKNLGFIIPSPSQPELSESGDAAFGALAAWTAPEFQQKSSMGCGCAKTEMHSASAGSVRVLDQKRVAGFDAVVLEADSPDALAAWLAQHGYALSPAVAEWAAPYIATRWKFTALKVAVPPTETVSTDATAENPRTDPPPAATSPASHAVRAAALRMTFKTDRPLFPYREPNSAEAAKTLGVSDRLLRIYFISDARYEGNLTPESPWTGRPVWADKLDDTQRGSLVSLLTLTPADLPGNPFLTEFEDHWPYRQAPADLYFSREASQKTFHRPAINAVSTRGSVDMATLGFCGVIVVRKGKRWAKGTSSRHGA